MHQSNYFRYACTGLDRTSCPFRDASAEGLSRTILVALCTFLCLGLNVRAQVTDSRAADDANKSWKTITDSRYTDVVPARIVETHGQAGDRTTDKRSVQLRGYSGEFDFYQDVETETLQMDANTVRSTTRTFARDGNKTRTLVEVTEETTRTLPNNDLNTIRITSQSDLNGKLQVVKREVVETKNTDNNTQETNTTLLLLSVEGGLAPAIKTHEIRKRDANNIVTTETKAMVPDGAGNWQVNETRQSIMRGEAGTIEERVSRLNAEGKLTEVSRVMARASEDNSGEKRDVVETYSVNLPGAPPDGNLHLVERATTLQDAGTNGELTTEKRVEQPNPGDPYGGLRPSILSNERVRQVSSGLEGTRTLRMRDQNGNFVIVETDTTNSDKHFTMQIQPTPSEQPK